jgi:hypothetical protein
MAKNIILKSGFEFPHSRSDKMEQEIYYRYAEVAIQHVVFILHLILLNQESYVSLRSLVGQWSGVSIARMASDIDSATVNN